MIKKHVITIGIFLIILLMLPALTFANRWIINYPHHILLVDLEVEIHNAGGTLVEVFPDVSLAIADFTKREDTQAVQASGYEVMPDLLLDLRVNEPIPEDGNIGLDESFFNDQWHLRTVQADMAWQTGVTGSGVRVAVLDTGIWYHHPDLISNIDFAASASFVPGTTDFLDDNGHGTHIAGIIAAADNGWGTIGIAPNAQLIGVKVLSADGTGHLSWIVSGIVHAVNQGADIINLSVGYYLKKNGNEPYYTAAEASLLRRMVRRVINWATSRGVLVVNSAGNGGLNMDQTGNLISIPTEEGNGIIISATGPYQLENFDTFTSYSNYGCSLVWMSAPGGDFRGYPNDGWWRDMILSTTIDGWMWSSGTSAAASIVSGVAALVLEKYGPLTPEILKNILSATADDLGNPGKDCYYGHGRINAYRAVTYQ